MLPTYALAALKSMGIFYKDLQDIQIFVEDKDSEAFYEMLLSRLICTPYKIKKIIPLHGRINVVETCKNYTDNIPALFIIDGDIELLCNKRELSQQRLFQHRVYCVENYLFCKEAVIEVARNLSGTLQLQEIINHLNWEQFSQVTINHLIELFKVYATVNYLAPSNKTITLGYNDLCIQETKKKKRLCPQKISTRIETLRNILIEQGISNEEYVKQYNIINNHINTLPDPSVAISGKDYLLCALWDFLVEHQFKPNNKNSLKIMLARHCNLDPLKELSDAIKSIIQKNSYLQSQTQ